ncbi:hypothetical protein EKO04_004425 [Ascochyta lentis]|uniref:Uncharacterized protein n=1 Tax=Ascochyta lentis TaxID=205686 RepID=A0A8H7J6J1_9PLEO|nr:hypothetical protein EKO04_004425 [Ascochyta lentis]
MRVCRVAHFDYEKERKIMDEKLLIGMPSCLTAPPASASRPRHRQYMALRAGRVKDEDKDEEVKDEGNKDEDKTDGPKMVVVLRMKPKK